MKIILEPKVTVIAKQQFLGHPDFEIPDDGEDATKIGAFAAKGCYDSFSKTGRANEANQREILAHRHGSVLEHINYTLFIEGITRALSLESNRHRQFAVSQRSTRYTQEEDSAIVLEPFYASLWNKYPLVYEGGPNGWVYNLGSRNSLEDSEKWMLRKFVNCCEYSIQQYQKQVELLITLNPLELTGFDLRKWARGKARNLLPHALETRITYTGNLRAWRWFIESRSNEHAEPEIRRLADLVLRTLRDEASLYFEDFANVGNYDGIPVWVPEHKKV